ncbi:hypothetical protein A2U01_0077980, partial [Trifolium medium]|nr:hypothetical protein [Trifolium medium]
KVVIWILMGRSLLIRDRELVSSANFMGWVGVFSGGLEAKGCLSDYLIRKWTSWGTQGGFSSSIVISDD